MCSPAQAGAGEEHSGWQFRLSGDPGLCMCVHGPPRASRFPRALHSSLEFHLSNPLAQAIVVSLSTRGPAFSSHDCNYDRQGGEGTLGWCCQGACASSQRAFRKCRGEGAGVGKSQWLEQRLKAFGGRAWHANHPVLGQACTTRNFPTGYSSRAKNHIYNSQTYKLISTHT